MSKFFVKFFRVIRNKKVMKYVPNGTDVLDVGCGDDFYLLSSLRRKIKNGTGVDIAVKNTKIGNITIKKIRIGQRLPFRDASFNVVTMIAFVEHLDNPEKVLVDCRRVLRKDGIVIITTPMARAKPFWELLVKLGRTEEKTIEDHKQYFSQEKIEKLFKKTGFDVIVSRKFELGMNYIAVGRKNSRSF
ncbi:MAG TPA: class I SAM-dependent methyltransferase [archaeon]|nr:class I SAM-dependent methyltransferase [archaeon]